MRCGKGELLNPSVGASYARRRYEISTTGYDANLQGIGGDPFGGAYGIGIRLPIVPPPFSDFHHRYQVLLAKAQFNAHQKARIIGIRQYVELEAKVDAGSGNFYPVTLPVTSLTWHPVDGNISWHLLRVPPLKNVPPNAENADGLAFQYADTPALLFMKTPADVGGYVPPQGLPGTPALVNLANLHGMQYPWTNQNGGDYELNEEIQGPCDIVLIATVQQTNPSSRIVLPAPADLGALLPEDRFLLQYPTAVYGKIAGSILFEEENFIGDPYPYMEAPLPGGDVP